MHAVWRMTAVCTTYTCSTFLSTDQSNKLAGLHLTPTDVFRMLPFWIIHRTMAACSSLLVVPTRSPNICELSEAFACSFDAVEIVADGSKLCKT